MCLHCNKKCRKITKSKTHRGQTRFFLATTSRHRMGCGTSTSVAVDPMPTHNIQIQIQEATPQPQRPPIATQPMSPQQLAQQPPPPVQQPPNTSQKITPEILVDYVQTQDAISRLERGRCSARLSAQIDLLQTLEAYPPQYDHGAFSLLQSQS